LRRQRGLTFITVLMILAFAAGVWWMLTFAQAYWDNQEVKSLLHEAANLAYHEKDDRSVAAFITKRLHTMFDPPGTAPGKVGAMVIDFDPGDLRIERTQSPAHVNIWLTYSRTVKTPFVEQERSVTFTDHAEQDLTDVKW
jgi:hypothetical protein